MKIFISYGHCDRESAEYLRRKLTEAGHQCLGATSAHPGEEAAASVANLLSETDAFVLVISHEDRSCEWQMWEWRTMLEKSWETPDKRLVGLVLGDVEAPSFLRSRQLVRAADPSQLDAAIADMLRYLTESNGETETEPEELKPVVHERLEKVADEIAKLHMTEKDLEEQKAWLEERIENLTMAKPGSVDVAKLQLKLAKTLKMLGRDQELVHVLEKGVEILERNKEQFPAQLTQAQTILAKTLASLNDYQGAFDHASRALQDCEELQQYRPQIPALAEILATSADKVGQEAADAGRRILDSLEKVVASRSNGGRGESGGES